MKGLKKPLIHALTINLIHHCTTAAAGKAEDWLGNSNQWLMTDAGNCRINT